ncbi:MAG: hypothetical protein LC799_26425 [Actinobacteria bacterium]|nr:hypothetical protein [Actinomycetota bacterium]
MRVTGEERVHPALRTLGRACIALARWQRQQDTVPAEVSTSPPPRGPSVTPPPPADADDQEARDG